MICTLYWNDSQAHSLGILAFFLSPFHALPSSLELFSLFRGLSSNRYILSFTFLICSLVCVSLSLRLHYYSSLCLLSSSLPLFICMICPLCLSIVIESNACSLLKLGHVTLMILITCVLMIGSLSSCLCLSFFCFFLF